jgi:anthranilate synthase component II
MILMIDNYDSFTYNLVQMLAVAGATVEVVRNDQESVAALLARRPRGIVVSPGPGRPEDAGLCVELIREEAGIPLLGVCLGHQALGYAYGGTVRGARELMHGKTSPVHHEGEGPFAGLPQPFEATRYHSLVVDPEVLPEVLEPLAWTEDRTLMGMRHRAQPYWSVQFHPESVLTPAGPALMENFLRFCGETGE